MESNVQLQGLVPLTVSAPVTSSKPLVVPLIVTARTKKRPASPTNGVSGGLNKKKKIGTPQVPNAEVTIENKMLATDCSPALTDPVMVKPLPFKDANFIHSGIGGAAAGKKNRTWKNLKQILAAERALPWQLSDPNYFSIDAPPSCKPAKKYSDISGLPANYTDPQNKLRFSTTEEFSYIRMLPTDVITGYLALRKATSIVP